MSDKKLTIFAGPNGFGKSTIVNEYIESSICPENYICPDNLVSRENKSNVEAYRKAMREAETARFTEVAQGNSFSFETVLSRADKLDFIKHAQFHGYYVHVVYIITSCPDINIRRIRKRVEQGGHDVPTDTFLSRYEKSISLMFDVIRQADVAEIYDNSGESPQILMTKIDDLHFVNLTDVVNPNFDEYFLIRATDSGLAIKYVNN